MPKQKKILLLQYRPVGYDVYEQQLFIFRSGMTKASFDVHNFFGEKKFDRYIPDYTHVIMAGTSNINISDGDQPWFSDVLSIIQQCEKQNIHFLGVCLGMQLLAYLYGAKIKRREDKVEIGTKELQTINTKNTFFQFLPERFLIHTVHRDYVEQLPDCLERHGKTDWCSTHIISHKHKPLYGVQFHPEHNKQTIAHAIEMNGHYYWDSHDNQNMLDKFSGADMTIAQNILSRFITTNHLDSTPLIKKISEWRKK